jgi:hypothetical protein
VPLLALAALLLACQAEPAPTAAVEPAPPPPATASTAPVDVPTAPPPAPQQAPAAGAGSLPDLSQGLETGSCGRGPGNEGADSHFLGSFRVQGSQVTGTERWLLHANDKLLASKLWTAGTDCEVRWMMTGTTVPPQHCGDCDLGLQLQASVDLTGSTCPEDMVKREKSFQVRYDVRRGADGVAHVYFASSGKLLGQGYHQGDQLTYVTQHQCKWF